MVWSQSIDVDQPVRNDYAGNANPPFNMIDRHPVQIELPATTDITAQNKAAASSDERSCFFDSASNGYHAAELTGELSGNPLGI